MKVKNIVLGLTVLIVSIFFAQSALAACKAGKTEVTIVNPSGKAITICVPDAAVSSIGGPNDIIIPAVCPCFDQTGVETAIAASANPVQYFEVAGQSSITDEECRLIDVYDYDSYVFTAFRGPVDTTTSGRCIFPGNALSIFPVNACIPFDDLVIKLPSNSITQAEADACVAVLSTFAPAP